MLRFTCIISILFLCGIVSGQKVVSTEIQNMKTAGYNLQHVDLLKFQTNELQSRDNHLQGLKKGTIISLEKDAIESLFQGQNDFINVQVPLTDRTNMTLTLKRHEIFTPDFKLFTSSDPTKAIDYTPGLHYMGIVEGDPSSVVALSVFHDQVMAMMATNDGNFVIGPIKDDPEGRHIFYNDRDLDQIFNFECDAQDDGIGYTEAQLKPLQNNRDVNDCVRIYIEINNDIVTAKGGAIQATNYITGIFNQSFVLYANEQLTLTISEILAWTTTSPYTGYSSSGMLNSYRANTEFFNGDLSHLVSFDSIFGGVASINGPCHQSSPDYSKCFSGIRNSFSVVPIFSFPVFVITHEMGHLLGSNHTHACVWNGNYTAIDGCEETPCAPDPPLPPEGGTIMSYCYPSNGSFINFNLGFGPQPGNLIRNTINTAGNCLSACTGTPEYCTSSGSNSSGEHINKVVLGSINNLSGNNGGYGNYSSFNTTLTAGSTYTISLTPGFNGPHHQQTWKVWIDYNNDLDVYDSADFIGQGSGNGAVNITFTVPPNNPAVTTRMRIAMRYAGIPFFCGQFPYGEVEDYTITIVPGSASCSDGIQNQGESGVDCGGPCPACPTCSDGIQNQGETGVDCGGPCPSCPAPDSTILLGSYFETGMDSWLDGGNDVNRVSSSNSYEGLYSVRLADNSDVQSAMTSPTFNLSTAVGLHITFHFYAFSMESGEDFWVRYNDGSGNWVTIGNFVAGSNFNNNAFYVATVTVPNFVPTSAGTFRIQCDASDNNDQIYIDAVTIIKLNGTELIETGVTIQEVSGPKKIPTLEGDEIKKLVIYPNPSQGILNISLNGEIESIRVIALDGKDVRVGETNVSRNMIDISQLAPGIYFLYVQSSGEWYPVKFIKM